MRPVVLMSCGLRESGNAFGGSLTYVRAMELAGGTVVVAPPTLGEESVAHLCSLVDCLLLSGGVDVDPAHYGEEASPANGRVEPEVDALDLALARYALRTGKPVLGICRGAQVLNVAAGGTLYQDLPSQRAEQDLRQHNQLAPRWHATHEITIDGDSRLAAILGAGVRRVNSLHHQAVFIVGPGLRVAARAADGVIEAIETTGPGFALGLQWHPEAMLERHPDQIAPFQALIQAGKAARTGEG